MKHPLRRFASPPEGAMRAARRSRFHRILEGEMEHPRRASRDPLKGAMRAARHSRFHRILGRCSARRRLRFRLRGV